MTEKVAKYISESDTEPTLSPEKMKENADNAHITAGVSGESDEYGTASDDEESGDYSDEDETNSEGPDDDENEESVVLDAERQSGDGQEQDAETKKKVDDDEDRSNPQYIPKKGTFYEHDDRTEDADAEVEEIPDDESCDLPPGGSGVPGSGGGGVGKEKEKKDGRITKKWQASQDRWTHDRFDEGEQAPKSRSELVSSYGYDIRNEDGPPRARRRRRYGRGPTKYTRNWEDEQAYTKQTAQQKKPRPEDFPALGTEQPNIRTKSRRRDRQSSSEYKENNDRNIERNERHSHEQQDRQSFKDYKTSNRRSGQKTNERRNEPSDRNANRGNYNRQPNTIEYVNRNKEAPRDQRYENRQNYEQEMNYNRVMYQQQQQQQQQQQHQQQHQLEDERRYQKKSVERDNRVPVNQRLQSQEVMQNVVHMQQPPPMMRQEMVQQQKPTVQMAPPTSNVVMNDVNRTKRYSIQRQRQGMEVPQTAQMVVQQQQQQGQMSVQEQQSQMEAALLQQLQNEKLKQIQSSMGHQKQISYHQAIANQNSPPNSQLNLTAQPQQYQTPTAYYAPQNADYGQSNAQQPAPAQMLAATAQNAAPAAAPQYPYAYIQPQQAPPPHIQPQSFQPAPQTAPQYQPQPAYATGYQTATAAYNPATAQPAQPAAPIYQSQPPPNITHYFAQATTTHPAAPQPNPPQRVTRRPTNAIPILAPPDRKEVTADKEKSAAPESENIDHIIDNMFTRRPPIQSATGSNMKGANDPNAIVDAVKGLSLKEDNNKDEMDKNQMAPSEQVG